METETKRAARLTRHPSGVFVVSSAGAFVALSLNELQAIVQQAYDQHGILACPSYALEAERPTFAEGAVATNVLHGWTLTRTAAGEWVLSNGNASWTDNDVAESLNNPDDPYFGELVLSSSGCTTYVAEYRAGLQVPA